MPNTLDGETFYTTVSSIREQLIPQSIEFVPFDMDFSEAKTKNKAKEPLTIGTDPEFALYNKNKELVRADSVLSDSGLNNDFGYDGHTATAEIRVKPAKEPETLVQNIKKVLEENKKNYPLAFKNNMLCQSDTLAVGGHIHFGHSLLQGSSFEINSQKIGNNLDMLLAFPSMYIENQQYSLWRKVRSRYGHLGDESIRSQPWGMEYRVLPSFIANENLTRMIFYTAYAIAEASLFNDFKAKEPIYGFKEAFNNHSKDLLKPMLPVSFNQLKLLPRYKDKEYKKQTDNFIKSVQLGRDLYTSEIKQGWNIEFYYPDFLKVDKIETLIDKVFKALIVAHKNASNTPRYYYSFVKGNTNDLGCFEIAEHVNDALNNSFSENILRSIFDGDIKVEQIEILGLKKERKNNIYINLPKLGVDVKKQILAYSWDIASKLTHTTKIEKITDTNVLRSNTLAFGRKMREENLMIAEAIAVISILLKNRELFKSKDGNKNLKVSKKKMVEPIIKNTIKLKPEFLKVAPPLTQLPDKLGKIKLPPIIDLNLPYNTIKRRIILLNYTEQNILTTEKFDKLSHDLYELEHTTVQEPCHCLYTNPLKNSCQYHLLKWLNQIISSIPLTERGRQQNIPTLGRNCEDCGEWTSNPCTNCNCCDECCGCNRCANCEAVSDLICEHCGNCDECCECYACNNCGNRVYSDDFCGDCERCNVCCNC
jgi:hypothetical protein